MTTKFQKPAQDNGGSDPFNFSSLTEDQDPIILDTEEQDTDPSKVRATAETMVDNGERDEDSLLHRHMSRMLHTYANGGDVEAFNTGTYLVHGKHDRTIAEVENAVRNFLEDYPTPKDFEKYADQFKNIIEFYNQPEKGWDKAYYEPYLKAIPEFGRSMYGEEYDRYLATENAAEQERSLAINFERIPIKQDQEIKKTLERVTNEDEILREKFNEPNTEKDMSIQSNLDSLSYLFERGSSYKTDALTVDASAVVPTQFGSMAMLLTQPDGHKSKLRSCLKKDDGWYEVTGYMRYPKHKGDDSDKLVPVFYEWDKVPDDISDQLDNAEQASYFPEPLSTLFLFGTTTKRRNAMDGKPSPLCNQDGDATGTYTFDCIYGDNWFTSELAPYRGGQTVPDAPLWLPPQE